MAVKRPLIRFDNEWFEVQLPSGQIVKAKLTQEGFDAFKAIIDRLVAGGL